MKKLRKSLFNEKAAIDLASIMVGIVVLGLIGGVIAATVFAVIPWAQDEAAKSNLKSVQTAQNVYAGLAADPNSPAMSLLSAGVMKNASQVKVEYASSLEELTGRKLLSGVDSNKVTVATGETNACYVAMAKSDSGKLFWASDKTEPREYTPDVSTSDCASLETVANELNPPANPCFDFTPETGTITDYNNELEECGPDVVIPGTIGGVTVEIIGQSAFSHKSLTSVVIPDSVTTIGDLAFTANALTSVAIPDSVTTIGNRAFSNNVLTSVDLGEGVTTIADWAFYANALTSVTIPDSVTTIGNYAFYKNNLSSVDLGEGITTIGHLAFSENALTSVTIPDSVTTIGDHAFSRNALTSVDLGEGVTTIGGNAFLTNQLSSVYIPDSVTTIRGYAFYGNPLETVSIPSHLNPPSNAFPITPTKR